MLRRLLFAVLMAFACLAQATVYSLPWGPRPQFMDANGAPMSSGTLTFYAAGSTTPQNTYTDSTGGTPNANPITLNTRGETPNEVWLTGGVIYKIVLKDSSGSTVWTVDNLAGVNDVAVSLDEWKASGLTPTYVSATSFTMAGDQTVEFHVGRRLKTANSGGTVYSVITASAYAAGTTITVANDSGTLDAGLSSVSYGVVRANNTSVPWLKTAVNFAGVLSPSQITGNQNDYSPSALATANVLRISTSARWNITGLAGGTTGRVMIVQNVGTFPAVFTFQDAGSAAANRFAFGITLGGGQSMELAYDATSSLWRLKSGPPDPVGSLRDFAGGTVPSGYLACDGSAVSRTTYAALFNEIGTTWGVGDGATTFNVPDFRRRVAVGSGGAGTSTLGNALGNTGGEEAHTLTLAESPAHSHTASNTNSSGALGGGPAPAGSNNGGGAPTSSATDSQGGGGAHNVRDPSAVVTKMVKF